MDDVNKGPDFEIISDMTAKENDQQIHQHEDVASSTTLSETTTTLLDMNSEMEVRRRQEGKLDVARRAAWAQRELLDNKELMADMEQKYQENRREALAEQRDGKELYFFYGTLMDPVLAQEVLGLSQPPLLRPASVVSGGHLKMWGPYPALVDKHSRADIKGVVCEIEGGSAKDRVEAYEGDKYKKDICAVEIVGKNDGIYTVARVFLWCGDDEELTDGVFDLEKYKLFKAQLHGGQV